MNLLNRLPDARPVWKIGLIFFLLFVAISWSGSMFSISYVPVVLMAAPLVLLPLAWRLAGVPNRAIWLGLLASVLFGGAFLLPTGWLAALMVLPWLLLTILVAKCWWRTAWLQDWSLTFYEKMRLVAFTYLPIGAAWAVAARGGISPLGFDSIITLLTAVHFHYAGFLLPLLFAALSGANLHFLHWLAGYGILVGIPLVALGLTTSQLGFSPWLEFVCVATLVSASMLAALLIIYSVHTLPETYQKGLRLLTGVALLGGMSLALLYGLRFYYPIAAIDIPFMYALHGSLNAFGFAAPGLAAWYAYEKRETHP